MLNFAANFINEQAQCKKTYRYRNRFRNRRIINDSRMDDRTFDEKTEQLFKIYDDAMSSINSTWKIKDRSAVKQHYSKLYADVTNAIQAITRKK